MLDDIRQTKHAQLILDHSLEVKKHQLLLIRGSEETIPLIREIYRLALEREVRPFIQMSFDGQTKTFFDVVSDEELQFVSPIEEYIATKIDASVLIYGGGNTRDTKNVDLDKRVKHARSQKNLIDIATRRVLEGRLRRIITVHPTHSEAQEAGMSLESYTDYLYRCIKLDREDPIAEWRRIGVEQDRIIEKLKKCETLSFSSPGIGLKLNTKGRTWMNCSGLRNLPDGEIFTSPLENSVEGEIYFHFGTIREGHLVKGVKLVFREGIVVEASAEAGEEFLISQLGLDEGSRRVGEIAFGTNSDVSQLVGRILIDEKFGHAIHLALGRSLPGTNGVNDSVLHWDFIADMSDGVVRADGELIYEQGRFLI